MTKQEKTRESYRTVQNDNFPPRMRIIFENGPHIKELVYERVTWMVDGEDKGLRYGENPGQEAAFYRLVDGNLTLGEIETIKPGRYLVSDMELLQSGKHPGKTNLTDADNALNILRYFDNRPTAVIVKHNNPCGVARDDSSLERAYSRAYMADRIAAFGGCIALNLPVDLATAEAIATQYAEVVVAPEFEEGTIDILAKRKNLRIIRINNISNLQSFAGEQVIDFKSLIDGGIIAQKSFNLQASTKEDLELAECEYQGQTYRIEREPTEEEYRDMLFGWTVESGITSNSVIYVKEECTVGIGTGEQDRVGVAEIARDKAYRKMADRLCWKQNKYPFSEASSEEQDEIMRLISKIRTRGGICDATMVSDAFFPFPDGVNVGLNEGVRAVIQPGGSQNDHLVIEACNKVGATMCLTGQRSFKH